jgi:L-threonine kinase
VQSNRSLYQDFPPELRNAYGDALRAPEWSGKHKGLLDFAEFTLGYFASLCLSDYRSHHAELADDVESLIERLRKQPMTMGRKLELFEASFKAMPHPLVPSAELLADTRLEDVERFVAAVVAIETAIAGLSPGASPSAINVTYHVEQAQPGMVEAPDWWEAWKRLIVYRNRVTHPGGKTPWPTAGDGYWVAMAPLLHDALVEMLAHDAITESVLEHPVGTITRLLQRDTGEFVHLVCGEERGVLFEEEIVATTPVTERWAERWAATTATSFVLHRPGEAWSIRNPFWDLRNGLPPAMDMGVDSTVTSGVAATRRSAKRPPAREGRGMAPGTCGEFIQGVLPDQTRFHVTCPINMSSTVVVKLRPAEELTVVGLRDYQSKLALAVEYAVETLDLGAQEVSVWPWSDIDVGKGMGSSTADVLAGIRAVADAAGEQLSESEEGVLAARVESSDGSMYPGIAAVNHKTCEMVKAWDWYPEFAIVMLVPQASVDTDSILFTGQEGLADEYEVLLANMDRAIVERSLPRFAEQSTRSAELNQRFLVNPYSNALSGRLDDFGALGLNIGHTGSVCGILFPNTEQGQRLASEACFKAKEQFRDLKDVKVVTTPNRDETPRGRSADAGGDGQQADYDQRRGKQ